MAAEAQPERISGVDEPDALLRSALLLDLEVSPRGKLLKLGAVLHDRTLGEGGGGDPQRSLAALAPLAAGASCVLGHNLVRHDLPHLREVAPNHPVHRLPVVDTLVLSPLAFPEHPYHRLVKDQYQLVRESMNDPVADARLAATLFADEWRSFAGLRQTEPGLFALLHFLLATPEQREDRLAAGMALFFESLGGVCPSTERAVELLREWLPGKACANASVDGALFQTTAQRHAVAYAATWLRVAGTNSVLPPWVRLDNPLTGELITRWRELPCTASDCAYCRHVHDARAQLKRFFSFDDFRPAPPNPAGGSLQRDIVEAGMSEQSLLAILPTGGGKSLCFQLPALVRNYRRGVLTIVFSPLQALMKDQVDGLVRRTGTPFAAALYGLLTPPERGNVLRRVRMGDVALLYVSPEQTRNKSFRDAIRQREIGCWVFDEAHCLSKWGHDFRTDYLYAGRFIREFSQQNGGRIAPIACFTATAKREVKEEILKFFREEAGIELGCFEGGVERDNLAFEVKLITSHAKLERVQDLLGERLPSGAPGSAIVFRAKRRPCEEMAEFLREKGWRAAHFHAGLTPSVKKQVQDDFLGGELQVICATNAFGMGVDKEDIRLVIHADTPGSLENYLQEAGRAGRDNRRAECVLLYDEADCEEQFRLGAYSELSRRDIAQILRGLRKAARGGKDEVILTTGEILRDEDVETDIAPEDRSADTKVRTAISWLERAGFVQRDENVTQVFQARPLVRDLKEAETLMRPLNLSDNEQALWLAILRELMNADATTSLTVDHLALLPELLRYREGGPEPANPEYVGAKVLRVLGSMAQAGLLKRDLLLNAFVRYKVVDHSRLRLNRELEFDRQLVKLLADEEPDPEGWMSLNLRLLNQRLSEAAGRDVSNPDGSGGSSARANPACSTEMVRLLLKSLSEDGRGLAGTHGSIDLKYRSRDTYRVRVRRPWSAIAELADKRRRVASLVLDTLLGKIAPGMPPRADLLVEFSFDELRAAVERDPVLRADLKDLDAAIERALMFLHEQRVIVLQQGLAVFRSAMRIRLQPEARGEKYRAAHYEPLEHHYRERVLQVHVMSEYAKRGLERIQEAFRLVLAYFSLGREEFLRRFLGNKPELLQHATTAASFQRIVTDLGNRTQIKIVTAPLNRNLLILAGPGSGKTRTVVHRCAWLLRVKRVRPQSVLVCCFNRSAALELRKRLTDLVGADARGVTVLTYHALAMRLLGRSFSPAARATPGQAPSTPGEPDFDALITDAVKLLRGEQVPAGLEPDEVRDRLLAGFQFILVDEYQDIDAPQYELISAIAGRTLDDADQRLSILAVGDDDQNIYTFRGANVEFIRRFAHDYDAEVVHLVENYRSTRHIIEVSNQLIAANSDRMKTAHPIRIDEHRAMLPPGGDLGNLDRLTSGRVQVIQVRDEADQAGAVLQELNRLRGLGVETWERMAVLSKTHQELAGVRTIAEQEGVPVRWMAGRDALPPLHQVREIRGFLRSLEEHHNALTRATQLLQQLDQMHPLPARSAGFSRGRGTVPRVSNPQLVEHAKRRHACNRATRQTPKRATQTNPSPADNPAGTSVPGFPNPWVAFLRRALEAWREESGNAESPAGEAVEFLYEFCAECRRDFSHGEGVILSTVHAAKGTEHDHVLLIGGWPLETNPEKREELRRVFYVGMTRARRSLAVIDRLDLRRSLPATLKGAAVVETRFAPGPNDHAPEPLDYTALRLDDLHLSYPARFHPRDKVHAALARLQPGHQLTLAPVHENGVTLCDNQGVAVARLSRKAAECWRARLDSVIETRVVAMVCRRTDQETEPERRARCLAPEWEVPLVEIVARREAPART